MKKTLSAVIAVTMLLTLTLTASALEPGEGADFYVYDETGLLSEATKNDIYDLNGRLEDQYGAQLVIVFLNYFGATDPDELAVSLFNDWGVSGKGMLMVVSVKEQTGSMTVGDEITRRFTVSDIDTYFEKYFADDFYDGKYDSAVINMATQLARWYDGEFGGSTAEVPPAYTTPNDPAPGFFATVLSFIMRNIFVILLVCAVIFIVIRADRRRYRGYYSGIGMPIPRYYPWFIFLPRQPYHRYRPPAPPRPSPPRNGNRGAGSFGGFGGFGPSSSRPSSSRPSSRPSSPRPSSPRPSAPRPRGGGMGGRSGGSVGGFGRHR